jgi:hypothetical protein
MSAHLQYCVAMDPLVAFFELQNAITPNQLSLELSVYILLILDEEGLIMGMNLWS